MSTKGVILLGGPTKGTRFRPLSLATPKPLFPVAGKAMVYHQVEALAQVPGIKEVIMIGFFEDAVFADFLKEVKRDFPSLAVTYLREFRPLGTAGGLYHFRDSILRGSPQQIFVLNADICCSFPLAKLQEFHNKHRGVGTLMSHKMARQAAHKYGCIVVEPETSLALHYVEKPESFISEFINTGVYLFDKSVFEEIKSVMDAKSTRVLEDPSSLEDSEIIHLEQDLIVSLAADKKLFVYESKDFWRQIKTAGSAIPANSHYLTLAASKPETSSISLTKGTKDGPEIVGNVYIHPTAKVHPSAKVGPNVSIGAGAIIGAGSRIVEAIILDNVTTDQHSLISWSVVGADCKIGAWSRIEGSPENFNDVGPTKATISILANEVVVGKEICVRSCIVLPQKILTKRSFFGEVLL